MTEIEKASRAERPQQLPPCHCVKLLDNAVATQGLATLSRGVSGTLEQALVDPLDAGVWLAMTADAQPETLM
jgi:hypothetical protein